MGLSAKELRKHCALPQGRAYCNLQTLAICFQVVIKTATLTKMGLHQEADNFLQKTAVFPLMSHKISRTQQLPAVVGTALACEALGPSRDWCCCFSETADVIPACTSLLILL